VKPLRIVLADDHEMFRQGIKALIELESDLRVVGEAANGREALERVAALAPDLLVMDISMPSMSGIQLLEQLKKSEARVGVLVLTAFSDLAYVRPLLAAGATGYVLKHAAAEDLIEAIRCVARGGTYIDPAVAGQLVSGFVGGRKPRASEAGAELSAREREVLCDVARGFTNKEVAARLAISVKTVETHKSNLMRKLGVQGRAELVRYALARGWLQSD